MSSSVLDHAEILAMNRKRLNPAELKIDLLCHGAVIDETCLLREEGRPICPEPRDLASGLELILPGDMRELWVNVPIREKFAQDSPYRLLRRGGGYLLVDSRHDFSYGVKPAPRPDWYFRCTSSGTVMSQIGMLQGTLLWIDLGDSDHFWSGEPASPGRNISKASSLHPAGKSVGDVVETAVKAQKRSGITMVILRGGCKGVAGLARIFPYIRALKQDVGILVVLQSPPEEDLSLYDQAHALGVDHFSFYFEMWNRECMDRLAPAKAASHRTERSKKALEHCVRMMGKGRVSGEIIAGIEPIADTLCGIDYLAGAGALPLVNIFRPLLGTSLENDAPPNFTEMIRVFRHVYRACRGCHLPIGITPNVHLSALPHPVDTLYLAPDMTEGRAYQNWILTMQQVMRPYFLRRMRKHPPDRR